MFGLGLLLWLEEVFVFDSKSMVMVRVMVRVRFGAGVGSESGLMGHITGHDHHVACF